MPEQRGTMDTSKVKPTRKGPEGTFFQSDLRVTYLKLVQTFGKPNSVGDTYKIDAEWVLSTPSGIATIYNYKDGKNYLGPQGKSTEYIVEWHIGGTNKGVVYHIYKALGKELDLLGELL